MSAHKKGELFVWNQYKQGLQHRLVLRKTQVWNVLPIRASDTKLKALLFSPVFLIIPLHGWSSSNRFRSYGLHVSYRHLLSCLYDQKSYLFLWPLKYLALVVAVIFYLRSPCDRFDYFLSLRVILIIVFPTVICIVSNWLTISLDKIQVYALYVIRAINPEFGDQIL